MSLEVVVTVAVITGVLALLITDRLPPSVSVLGGLVVLLVSGVLTADQALAGFSNPAPFTVAALYVVARAVEKTGVLQPVLRSALAGAKSHRGALARLLVPVAAASAILNNTPIVAAISPQVEAWVRRRGHAPSRYLLPLSYAAIVGGTVTAIGTSTTLVVSGLLESYGYAPLGLFEVAAAGLPLALIGVVYVILAAPVLLPDRARPFHSLEEARDFTACMEVLTGGALSGVTVQDAGLRDLRGVFLAEVLREGEIIAPATPATRLQGGDLLVFVGQARQVLDLTSNPGLRSAEEEHARTLYDAGHTYFEVVVGPGSRLVGQTLKSADFRKTFQAAVLAIHRAGEPVHGKLGQVPLKAGDTLLLLADEGFRERWRDRSEFLLVAHIGGMAPTNPVQARVVAATLVAMVTAGALGWLSILELALLGATALVAGRVLTPGEARRAIDLDVILLIAGAFGLGSALEVTGIAGAVAAQVMGALGGWGPAGVVLGTLLLTLMLTELVTNNAAAVLVFPLALSLASAGGIPVRPLAILVAVAASASFLTPLGYQTNTMVFGPGGYRASDYLRFGAPLTLLSLLILMGVSRFVFQLF